MADTVDNPMRPLDPRKQKLLEVAARPMAQAIGGVMNEMTGSGFALFLFTTDGPEMVYVSNADRAGMIKVLKKFIADHPDSPISTVIM